MKRYSCAVVTKTGRRRNNQDNYMLAAKYAPLDHDFSSEVCSGDTSKPLFAAVCDGMGGEESGERASFEGCAELAAAANALGKDPVQNKSLVDSAIIRANARLCAIMKQDDMGRMGSTVISVLLQNDTLSYTNLGDSRIYMLREGKLYQLTKDHTEGQAMVDAGVLTPEQLRTHPSRNKLSLHLGIFPDEMYVEPAKYADIELHAGDKLLLCSDGVFGVLEPSVITTILGEKTAPAERAAKLVDTAFESGSKDNMTAMVIDIADKKRPVFPFVILGILLLAALCAGALLLKKYLDERADDISYEQETEAPADMTDIPAEGENNGL